MKEVSPEHMETWLLHDIHGGAEKSLSQETLLESGESDWIKGLKSSYHRTQGVSVFVVSGVINRTLGATRHRTVRWQSTPRAIKKRGRKNYDGWIDLGSWRRALTSAHVVFQGRRRTRRKDAHHCDSAIGLRTEVVQFSDAYNCWITISL